MFKFFDDWSDIYVDYRIEEDEKARRLLKYMLDNIGNYMKILQEYKDRK